MSTLTITLSAEPTTPVACTPVLATPVAAMPVVQVVSAAVADVFESFDSDPALAPPSPSSGYLSSDSVCFRVSAPTSPVAPLPESDESPRATALYPTAWNASAAVTAEQLADEAGLPPAPSFKATLMNSCGVALNLVAIGVSIAAAVAVGMLVSAALSSIFYGIVGLLVLSIVCRVTAEDSAPHKISKFIVNQGLHTVGQGLIKLGEFVWHRLPSMPRIPALSYLLNRA